MKTTAVIAVRTGSSRLPDKALLPIMGESMMGRMIERIQHAPSIDEVMIATTELPGDDRLEAMARRLGVECYRGSTDDVLDRIAKAVAQARRDRAARPPKQGPPKAPTTEQRSPVWPAARSAPPPQRHPAPAPGPRRPSG